MRAGDIGSGVKVEGAARQGKLGVRGCVHRSSQLLLGWGAAGETHRLGALGSFSFFSFFSFLAGLALVAAFLAGFSLAAALGILQQHNSAQSQRVRCCRVPLRRDQGAFVKLRMHASMRLEQSSCFRAGLQGKSPPPFGRL